MALKPDTDDTRESRAIPAIEALIGEGVNYRLRSKSHELLRYLPQIEYSNSADGVIAKSAAVLIVTKWREFEKLDYERKIGNRQ